jgi:superfamily II DNA or RNA helicase
MGLSTQGTQLIAELMSTAPARPDFSFLERWASEGSFFPRLNNMPRELWAVTREKREELPRTVEAISALRMLATSAAGEFSPAKSALSNAISVFHRDGEVAAVALPVTPETAQALGGFLLARDVGKTEHGERFLAELSQLTTLVEAAQMHLRWRWWPRKKELRTTEERAAAQLLLAASAPGDRNLYFLEGLLQERAGLSSGARQPTPQEWQEALLGLESLKDFSPGAIITTVTGETLEALSAALPLIRAAFQERDQVLAEAQAALERVGAARLSAHMHALSLEAFAKLVKGQRFPRRALEQRLEALGEHTGAAQPLTAGNLLLQVRLHPEFFDSKNLQQGVALLTAHRVDQERLLSYPRLSGEGPELATFLQAAYTFYLHQQRPTPVRAQFDTLARLLEHAPQELHLVARNEATLKKLFGALESYVQEERLAVLQTEVVLPSAEEAREFFTSNPATYQALLSSFGLHALTLEQLSGFLAPELTSEIRRIELELSGLRSPLRSYQLFGAQYAFHQRRIILGDEPGLGKTVQALALATHLKNEGATHTLVVVPLAVLENWRREVLKHTEFTPRVLYGEELEEAVQLWSTAGGIALATYESLQKINQSPLAATLPAPQLTVVDEAHLIKNETTLRAQHTLPWVRASEWTMLLTGTPLENTIEEFAALVRYVQPQLPLPEDRSAYGAFRKAVAPAYLRRNQVDVLQELPELQEDEEYIRLSEADREYYLRALERRDWHGLRRAKVLAGKASSTVQRIEELVDEALATGQKVLLFSFYREGIDALKVALGNKSPYEPLTGDLSSVERQQQVDRFTADSKPAVLLAQAKAGGTGLNIQAASLVIIVEPQVNPALEDQMVRRAYRMGQLRPVRVVRLRGKDTIDQRWVAMHAEKSKVFSATAGMSEAAALAEEPGDTAALLEAEARAWAPALASERVAVTVEM